MLKLYCHGTHINTFENEGKVGIHINLYTKLETLHGRYKRNIYRVKVAFLSLHKNFKFSYDIQGELLCTALLQVWKQ